MVQLINLQAFDDQAVALGNGLRDLPEWLQESSEFVGGWKILNLRK